MLSLTFFLTATLSALGAAQLTDSSLKKYVNSLALSAEFGPVKEAYWTGYPHHRRTPFALSPDGTTAYLAYLDGSETGVHVQQVDPDTFEAVGTAVTVSGGQEAGGLVAHNDGFALLTNEALPSGTSNAPADSTPVPVLYRYTSGKQTWKTFLGGPGVHADFGLAASPDLNGDLVYSEEAQMYGAYFVITAYSGSASGHYGDSIQYVTTDGTLKVISGASSSWGCSHNTGIAFEAADAPPYASVCAEDQGAIWLNTKTQGMTNDGVKISNENTTNGASNEPMGGMSGSYSGLARFIGKDSYIFTWVSRGATDLTTNDWMGTGYTHCINRTVNRNVAIAVFSDKNTLVGQQATSVVGSKSGDDQVNWITTGTADRSNAHVAAFDGTNALVAWEEIGSPICDFLAMGCRGTFTGSYFQQVDSSGKKVGSAIKSMDTYVAGDMVTMADGRICWPYVNMTWSLSSAVSYGGSSARTTKMSFACMSLNGSTGTGSTTTSVTSSSAMSASSATTPKTQVASSSSSSTAPTSTSTKTTATRTTSPVSTNVSSTSKATSTTLKTTSKVTSLSTSTRRTRSTRFPHTRRVTTVTTKATVLSSAAPGQTTLVTLTRTVIVSATSASSVDANTLVGADGDVPTSTVATSTQTTSGIVPTGAGRATLAEEVEEALNGDAGVDQKKLIKKLWDVVVYQFKLLREAARGEQSEE